VGRLDDIAARNKQAMGADNLLVKAVGKLGDGKPGEAAAPFTLPSQRTSGTAMWKVLIRMLAHAGARHRDRALHLPPDGAAA
jgi:hypothetical protein